MLEQTSHLLNNNELMKNNQEDFHGFLSYPTTKTVEEHQQSESPPSNSAASLKHGMGSGGKFLSVPGKQLFGKNWHEKC